MASLNHCTVAQLAELYKECQAEIISEWRALARNLLWALQLDNETITDHMPNLVVEIIRNLALSWEGALPAEYKRDSPPAHGVQRFYDGLHTEEVVAEYNLLRGTFITVAERRGIHVVGEALLIINNRIDHAVRMAVAAYAAEQESIRRAQEREHLAFIAHDLRTPLNAACLVVDELSDSLSDEVRATAGDLFDVLRRNLGRIAYLVKKVMDRNSQSPSQGSSFRPELRRFDLWPLVQRLIVDLRPVAAKSGITIINEIPRSITVDADAGLLSQVFQNLLGNSFKYAENGTVRISAHGDPSAVTCTVTDDGAGIPEVMMPRIFDKLATDPEKEGRGLGLTIVKQIVEAHGGTVTAESTCGKGATFIFTIPAAETD